ncbi:hypothetical protein [Rickettsiella endosymbiont of Aleochara curtula]|uniref:hypothetical protein n=1 Tax=Rickettsiella endosymbiont of Aleochara curtula TaxID=3077936 RepID=UPI00313E4E08
MIPSKKDPTLPKYSHQLQILNRFSNFIANTGLNSTTKENAYKVIDCLKFIKINLDFIGYAVEHRNDDSIYTYAQDKPKGVIRDFNNTAMHFNSYSSTALVQLGLKNLVEQFEQAIEAMQKKHELEAFAKKLHFDGDIGCIEARTAAALSFAATRLSSVVHSLDDRMEEFYSLSQNDNDPSNIVNKAIDFFKPWMGQQAIWGDTKYVINSALIKRYLTEILVINLPAAIILDELKEKEGNPHHLALIEDISSQELIQVLLTREYGLKFLKIVSLNQSSEVILALLHKIDNETIKKLFNENPKFFNAKFLNLLLENHSAAVCEALFEKLSEQGIDHFNTQFKEILLQRFKKSIKPSSFFTFIQIKATLNYLVENRVKNGIFCLIGLSFTLLTALAVIGIPYTLTILLTLSGLSIGCFPFIGAFVVVGILAVIPIIVLLLLGIDFIRIVINPFKSIYKFHNLKQNLLNNVLALQSTRLLALFFSNFSSQQLKTLNFPLIDLQKRLPDLLFTSNLSVAPEIEDTFYQYWYSNSTLRSLLIDNEQPLLVECINNYFEGKLAKPHPKIILLIEECLAEKAKKQDLWSKEQAFLEDIKQNDQVFPQKSLEEIWLNGVGSWSYYRYLKQKNDLSTQILVDRLLLKNELFGADWRNENFTQYLCDFRLKQKEEQQAFETAKSCIKTNNGLAKVIKPNNWRFFMKQLANPKHRESSLRKSVPITDGTKKYVHLTDKVISYQKDRHPKPKTNYSHTKKTSTTLLSPHLLTFLFSSDGGILFDRRQCQVKALLLRNAITYKHKWVGEETSVNNYKSSIQGINETNEQRFIEKIQTTSTMNEVLAKLNKEALRAIIIQSNTPTERLSAIQRRDEIESTFSKRLPILFYEPAQKSLKTYTLLAQERDQYNEKKDIPRGNRLWGYKSLTSSR